MADSFQSGIPKARVNMNVAPLQGERHGSAVPMVFMP